MCETAYYGKFGVDGPVLRVNYGDCLFIARECYAHDEIDVAQLEKSVAHVLKGGHLTKEGIPLDSLEA